MIYRRRDFNPLAIEHQIIPASSLRLTSIQDRMISYTAKNTAYPYTHAYIYIHINGRYKTSSIKKKEKEGERKRKEKYWREGIEARRLVVVHVIYSGTMRGRGDKDTDASWATTIHEFVNRIFPPVPRVHGYDTVTSRESREVTPPSLLARTAPHNRPIDEKRLHGWNKLSRLGDD